MHDAQQVKQSITDAVTKCRRPIEVVLPARPMTMPAKDEPPSRLERGWKKPTEALKKWFIPKAGGGTFVSPPRSQEQTKTASSQLSETSKDRSASSMAAQLGDHGDRNQQERQHEQQSQQSARAFQPVGPSGFGLMNRPEVLRSAEQKNSQATNTGSKPLKP